MVCKVLSAADLTTVLANEAGLLVALYQQGRSVTDVVELPAAPVPRSTVLCAKLV